MFRDSKPIAKKSSASKIKQEIIGRQMQLTFFLSLKNSKEIDRRKEDLQRSSEV